MKYISRLFAKNLDDFNMHLFGETVYYSVSPLQTCHSILCVVKNLPNLM